MGGGPEGGERIHLLASTDYSKLIAVSCLFAISKLFSQTVGLYDAGLQGSGGLFVHVRPRANPGRQCRSLVASHGLDPRRGILRWGRNHGLPRAGHAARQECGN